MEMDSSLDYKFILQEIVNGTLVENVCCICLLPLDSFRENIFTTICKANNEYCIAEVLEVICNISFSETEPFFVCSDCFVSASAAYRFYLLAKRSNEILNLSLNHINNSINSINLSNDIIDMPVIISLPVVKTVTKEFNYDLEGLAMQYGDDELENQTELQEHENVNENKKSIGAELCDFDQIKTEIEEFDDHVLIFLEENDQISMIKPPPEGTLSDIDKDENDHSLTPTVQNIKKKRRNRPPMTYKKCSKCPVKYRFFAKLKEHMKSEHNIDLFLCKVCNASIEDEQEFHNHLQIHKNVHSCPICNTVFKKHDTLMSHIKKHEENINQTEFDRSHICSVCKEWLPSEDHLKDHYENKHKERFTCYYCGRMYKGEISFELHLKKHEMYLKGAEFNKNEKTNQIETNIEKAEIDRSKKRQHRCDLCCKNFVDERALMWHQRLHNNERPYICEVCGRGFVSLNRRKQHAVCAHTAPRRRCPLCPALFHLRSMVNSHIKKVHLKAHKRRNRTSKHRDVFWPTETVPIQELSVSIQNQLLEIQTAQDNFIVQ